MLITLYWLKKLALCTESLFVLDIMSLVLNAAANLLKLWKICSVERYGPWTFFKGFYSLYFFLFFLFLLEENGYQNVRLHVVENVFYFNFEDENKIRETVANIVGCSIEDIRVNGYRHSNSFYLVLSIREIYISQLFTIQQHDKDKLLKLKIDCFEDDLDIVRVGYITGTVWLFYVTHSCFFL